VQLVAKALGIGHDAAEALLVAHRNSGLYEEGHKALAP
jgi:hypothetical protein